MGNRANSTICYGFLIKDGSTLPWNKMSEDYEKEFEDIYDWWATKKEESDSFNLPFEVEYSGSEDNDYDDEVVICLEENRIKSDWDDILELNPNHLNPLLTDIFNLKEICEKYGIPIEGLEPKWYLCSYWS